MRKEPPPCSVPATILPKYRTPKATLAAAGEVYR
jgi:hypothetical protein